MLQRDRREAEKPRRVCCAPRCEPLVLNFDETSCEIAIRFVPPAALVAEHLNVDAALIEGSQPRGSKNQGPVELSRDVRGEIRIFDDVHFFRRDEMTVNIYHLDPAIPD